MEQGATNLSGLSFEEEAGQARRQQKRKNIFGETAGPLVRLVEVEEKLEASDHSQGGRPQNWDGTEPNRTVTLSRSGGHGCGKVRGRIMHDLE
ncbi:hypothetical protein TNCV_2696761 [Trichonephila clavipes]|nr:hypothetical protein TNCV_2696761 [Trichonephila clavipes]